MDVAEITMPPAEARARLSEYRRGLHRRTDTEWERAAMAYKALAKGTPLIVLSDAIRSAPVDEKGRSMLAIARADRVQVRVEFDRHSQRATFNASSNWRSNARDLAISVDLQRAFPANVPWYESLGYALIPMVPPNVRGNRALNTHFILWEVEQWANKPISAIPPVDPYLLKRIADDLFAVVGAWDLTDVERAVMADRARRSN